MEACRERSGLASGRGCVAPAVIRRLVLGALLVSLTAAAKHRTANFIVEAPDPTYAAQVAQAAEHYRRQLAIEWLGKELPNWSQPCPITVNVGPHLGAGGATTFVFDRGEVYGWRMTIQGPADRLIDSVLPHEITHMIFASHFRRPLPRWADEGAATTVEHPSERNKYRAMLHQVLRSGQGISLSQMFALKDYPSNPLPLYAQSHSLADYLIQLGGRQKYVLFVGDGLKSNDWPGAVRRHYGVSDLGQLQNTWLAWVQQGSPPLRPHNTAPEAAPSQPLLAAAGQSGRVAPASFGSSDGGTFSRRPADRRLADIQPQLVAQAPTAAQAQASEQPSRVPEAAGPAERDAGSLAAVWQPAERKLASETRNAADNTKAVPLGRLVPVARLPEESLAAGQVGNNTARPLQPPSDAVAVSLPPLPEPVSATPAGWWGAGTPAAPAAPVRSGASLGPTDNVAASGPVAASPDMSTPNISSSQLGRPQTPQGPRHIIIQWGTR